MKKILGLDLGTNSIGWALVADNNGEKEILGMGSRIIPMGSDKIDYEKGAGITKNADRRMKRTARRMSKRYKLRRNKLFFILNELGLLPDQFQFKDGIPESKKIQDLELLPIKKGAIQLDSLAHYEMRVNAISKPVDNIKDFGKILYQFNQLRGYSGGNNDDDSKKKKEDAEDDEKKKYEVITQKVEILKIEKSELTFKARSGKNKGEELNKYDVTILLDDSELECVTELQNLEAGKEEELEIRIKRTKKSETVTLALPQKTNWRKQMEATEEILKTDKIFISELILIDLKKNKWAKIRNRVTLRNRYKEEFDAIWNTQAKMFDFLDNCPKEKLEKIARYLFPGEKESQQLLRKDAVEKGLKYIVKEQIIYYQRPLRPQTELISKCQFEKEEQVIANSHPLFQEFRCWDQINRLYITSKKEVYNEKKKKNVFQHTDRFLTNDEKQAIYLKLQNQKQLGFAEVAKIVQLKNDKTEYLNGLHVKAKLKGCDTILSIKKTLGGYFDTLITKDASLLEKIWKAVFDNANFGSEYDSDSKRVSSITDEIKNLLDDKTATGLALNIAQNIKFPRKYANLSDKAIRNILPLMQLNPPIIPQKVKENFEKVQHLIETGEILDESLLEDYVISFVQNNPDLLEKGGIMYAFASSLVYGKHTKETTRPQFFNYHDIQYAERNLRNPIVEQIVNEAMQVVKAIWKEHKFNPQELEIRVELARELKNSAAERDKIYKGHINSQKINDTIKKRLAELKQEATQGNIDLYKLWSRQNIEEYPKQSKEPTQEEIQKLRLWEEQKCISPYTMKPIPLSQLFSPERLYDIDHIIPKSRYFDDSISNKVVCETNINEEKGNRTAWEYISQQSSKFEISSIEGYINHINNHFYGKKKHNLLAEKIPSNPVERQIKDTQYISIAVKNELAKIVGSENVKTTTGEITSFLRSRWGLKKLFMKLTENRFKQMELWDWDYEKNQPKTEWVSKYFDKEKQKHIYEIKNWSKRYDHRHHAIDALVVALTEQWHIQRLNNLNKYLQDELTKRNDEFKISVNDGETILEAFFNLEEERRKNIQEEIESSRYFEAPIPLNQLIPQVEMLLQTMIVSHKPKDKLGIKIDKNSGKKQLKIRGALHEETYYGKLNGQDTKTIDITKLTAKDVEKIIDRKQKPNDKDCLKEEIEKHRKKYESIKEALSGEGLKTFNDDRIANGKPPVYKVKVWYNTKEAKESSLQPLYDNNKKLGVVTGDNYMFIVMEKDGKRIFDIVSLYDSTKIAGQAIKETNFNFKQKIADDIRIMNEAGKVLFTLQQNELVYLPENADDPIIRFTKDELKDWLKSFDNKVLFNRRIYKVVKFTGKDCFFIPHTYANTINAQKELTEEQKKYLKEEKYKDKAIPKTELNFEEFGSFGTSAKTEVNENFVKELTLKKDFKGRKSSKIQESCVKIAIDWLGNVTLKNND